MSATPITASTRYFLPGTTKVYIVPVIADFDAGPTRIELDAGTDISEEIAAINGWAITSAQVPTPDLGKRFVSNVNGRLTAAESGFTCWADKAGEDIRAILSLDMETNVVFLDGGDVAGQLMDAYKVSVSSVSKLREIEAAGRVSATFSIRDFNENIAVPATV